MIPTCEPAFPRALFFARRSHDGVIEKHRRADRRKGAKDRSCEVLGLDEARQGLPEGSRTGAATLSLNGGDPTIFSLKFPSYRIQAHA
jgi:hypothetical protein